MTTGIYGPDIASRLLAAALAKPKAHVAWLSPTRAMSKYRARELTELLAREGRSFKLQPISMTIRLHNGSEIVFVSTDPRDLERLRGLNLAAVAAQPDDVTATVRDLLMERLLRGGGEMIQ